MSKNASYHYPVGIPSHVSPSVFKSGRRLDKKTRRQANTRSTRYTRLPPSISHSFEKANKDENAAGPTARAIEVVVWLRPFILPSEYLFGAALATNTLVTAEDNVLDQSIPLYQGAVDIQYAVSPISAQNS